MDPYIFVRALNDGIHAEIRIEQRAYRVRILMPIGSEKSDDAESDNRHERAKSDHNQVERGHDAPKGRFTRP